MKLKWSIIICTYDRAVDLKAALSKLSLLNYRQSEYEIIVIDNGSTDQTAEVVNCLQKSISNLHCVKEERAGLSHARNKGFAEAQGEFIAFIDDDAWPELDWLEMLEECFQDQSVACVGGMVKPFWESLTEWPEWLHERLTIFFTVKEYPTHRKLHYPDYPAGTNIAFRKLALEKIGGFNAELGRIGNCLLSGEESEFCLRMEKAGYVIHYTPQAVVYHKVHESRLNRQWVLQRSYWQGVSSAIIEKMHLGTMRLVAKCCKYSILLALMVVGKFFFAIAAQDKLSFFCKCQEVMCKSYLMKICELNHA